MSCSFLLEHDLHSLAQSMTLGMAFGFTCLCVADEASVLVQFTRLEAKLGSRRVQHMCAQLTDLLGLLAAVQALPGPSGQQCYICCIHIVVLLNDIFCQLAHQTLSASVCFECLCTVVIAFSAEAECIQCSVICRQVGRQACMQTCTGLHGAWT